MRYDCLKNADSYFEFSKSKEFFGVVLVDSNEDGEFWNIYQLKASDIKFKFENERLDCKVMAVPKWKNDYIFKVWADEVSSERDEELDVIEQYLFNDRKEAWQFYCKMEAKRYSKEIASLEAMKNCCDTSVERHRKEIEEYDKKIAQFVSLRDRIMEERDDETKMNNNIVSYSRG